MKHEDHAGYKFRLINNQMHKQMEARKQENEGELTGMQRWTMGFLKEHEGQDIYQRDIEAAFHVSRATATNMLKVMERKELIERKPVPKDARLKKIVLTEKALKMQARAEQDICEMEAAILNGFSKEEEKQFKEYLNRVMKNIGADKDC